MRRINYKSGWSSREDSSAHINFYWREIHYDIVKSNYISRYEITISTMTIIGVLISIEEADNLSSHLPMGLELYQVSPVEYILGIRTRSQSVNTLIALEGQVRTGLSLLEIEGDPGYYSSCN